MLYPKPNVPPHPDWIVAQQWMAQHDVSFHLPADLTQCPIQVDVLHTPKGDLILMSDSSKEIDDHAWSAIVIDSNRTRPKSQLRSEMHRRQQLHCRMVWKIF